MFTIYGLYEAGKPDEIQYVGCTRQALAKRLIGHLSTSRRQHRQVSEWIARATKSGIVIECRTIQRTKDKDAQHAVAIEKKWITYYARQGHLLNVRDNPNIIRHELKVACKPLPIDKTFGNETVKNFLTYLRNLPIV